VVRDLEVQPLTISQLMLETFAKMTVVKCAFMICLIVISQLCSYSEETMKDQNGSGSERTFGEAFA